jgi:uncharacterized membrane protein YsdA (DUF1294 family)
MSVTDRVCLAWLGLSSALVFLLLGRDSLQARGSGRRVREVQRVRLGAAGGWLGGLAGMWIFRHKTRKGPFLLKYAAGLLAFVGLITAYLRWR